MTEVVMTETEGVAFGCLETNSNFTPTFGTMATINCSGTV